MCRRSTQYLITNGNIIITMPSNHTFFFILLNTITYAVKDDSRLAPEIKKAILGKSINLSCDSYYNPIWFFKQRNVKPVSYRKWWIIKPVQLYHGGVYFCFAFDKPKYNSPITSDYRNQTFLAKIELKIYGI